MPTAVSQISLAEVKKAARIDYNDDDALIEGIMSAAKSFLIGQTGLTQAEIDEKPEFVHAFYALCINMYDNRGVIVDNTRLNPTVRQICAMHRVNYL
jgi:uncharacterized phage protein (predicted DNA packaging)